MAVRRGYGALGRPGKCAAAYLHSRARARTSTAGSRGRLPAARCPLSDSVRSRPPGVARRPGRTPRWGVSACARRTVAGPASERPMARTFPARTMSAIAPMESSGVLDSELRGRRGASSRGRRGRDRGARGAAVDGLVQVGRAPRLALVATTASSRRSRTARPHETLALSTPVGFRGILALLDHRTSRGNGRYPAGQVVPDPKAIEYRCQLRQCRLKPLSREHGPAIPRSAAGRSDPRRIAAVRPLASGGTRASALASHESNERGSPGTNERALPPVGRARMHSSRRSTCGIRSRRLSLRCLLATASERARMSRILHHFT